MKSRYSKMFVSPLFSKKENGFEEIIDSEIKYARKNLKKSDRITWYLKELKYEIFRRNMAKLSLKEVLWAIKFEDTHSSNRGGCFSASPGETLRDRAVAFIDRVSSLPGADERSVSHDLLDIRDIKEGLTHYLTDMDVASINETVFLNQSHYELFDDFDRKEAVWREARLGRSVEEYGKPVMEFEDGLTWFDLQRSGCRAMFALVVESAAEPHIAI